MQLHDLARAYETKADEQLLELAADPDQLTPEAQTALKSELARRRIQPVADWSLDSLEEDSGSRKKMRPKRPGTQLWNTSDPNRFVAEVVGLYHCQFWLFAKLTAPAIVVGYIATILRRREVHAIARHLLNDGYLRGYSVALVEMEAATLVANLFTWILFCLSFAAICSATSQLLAGARPSFPECFVEVRSRVGPFLGLSFLFFFLAQAALAAVTLLASALFWAMNQRHTHAPMLAVQVVTFGCWGLALLVLSRFGLAMPALILDHYRVGPAMFRSDDLTAGKWRILAILTAKSVIGGYVAGMFPFWLASWLWPYIRIPGWLLDVASIAGVVVVEPVLFIGFALLYEKTSSQTPDARQSLFPERTWVT